MGYPFICGAFVLIRSVWCLLPSSQLTYIAAMIAMFCGVHDSRELKINDILSIILRSIVLFLFIMLLIVYFLARTFLVLRQCMHCVVVKYIEKRALLCEYFRIKRMSAQHKQTT